jgi:excisionase family DNA binding protein
MKLILQKLDEIQAQLLGNKKVLNADEAAAYTGLAKSYLYKLTAKNMIPFSKPSGKLIFFSTEDLDNWMLSNRTSGYMERVTKAATYLATKAKN